MDYNIKFAIINFILIFISPLVLIVLTIKLINWFIEDAQNFPLNDVSRQAAGGRVRRELNTKLQWLVILATTLPVVPVLLYAVYMMSKLDQMYALNWFAYALALIFLTHAYFVVRFLFQAGRLKLTEHAEIVVGEQLNELMHADFRVYHDVKVNNVFIDHLLLSTKGIYAVTVAAHPKLLTKKEQQFRVRFENQALIFPNAKHRKAISVAQKQANYAIVWLKKMAGDAVKVRPVLVVPGWYIELKDRPPFPIITTKQINTFFSRAAKHQIDEYTFQKMIDQIEQRPNL